MSFQNDSRDIFFFSKSSKKHGQCMQASKLAFFNLTEATLKGIFTYTHTAAASNLCYQKPQRCKMLLLCENKVIKNWSSKKEIKSFIQSSLQAKIPILRSIFYLLYCVVNSHDFRNVSGLEGRCWEQNGNLLIWQQQQQQYLR